MSKARKEKKTHIVEEATYGADGYAIGNIEYLKKILSRPSVEAYVKKEGILSNGWQRKVITIYYPPKKQVN